MFLEIVIMCQKWLLKAKIAILCQIFCQSTLKILYSWKKYNIRQKSKKYSKLPKCTAIKKISQIFIFKVFTTENFQKWKEF